ncbi:5-hydroxytryptamine receptor [Eufriesea mexicana]|nr:5-hydroxytryptamine receptor [Eufriesea mexicana]
MSEIVERRDPRSGSLRSSLDPVSLEQSAAELFLYFDRESKRGFRVRFPSWSRCECSVEHRSYKNIFGHIGVPEARNPRRIGMLIVTVWVVSLGISLAPQLGWKDPDYLDRIANGTCLVSQDPAYQIFATCATFYLPLLVILFLYWRIFQAARKRIRKRPGTIVQPPRERKGILRLVTRRPREESTAFTITRSTPDHSSISPEKSSSYNGANATQSTTVTPSAISTTTTTTTTTVTNPSCSHSTSSSKRTRETIESKRERKAAKTLAIITGAFVVCWLPFFLIALLRATCEVCEPSNLIASVFLWLGYFNSTLNPVIYTVFSPEFRQAFKRMLCGGSRIIR